MCNTIRNKGWDHYENVHIAPSPYQQRPILFLAVSVEIDAALTKQNQGFIRNGFGLRYRVTGSRFARLRYYELCGFFCKTKKYLNIKRALI